MRGSQREESFQKTSLKAKKNFSAFRPQSFLFLKLVSSALWPFYCFYLMYASFGSVTAKNGKILTPTPTGNFLLTSNGLGILRDESYSGLRSPGRNLRSGSIFVSLCNNMPAGKAKRKQSLINLLRNLLPTFLIDWHLPNQPTKITSVACFSSVQIFHEWENADWLT